MHFKKSNDNQSTILHEGSVPYLTFKKLDQAGVRHGFSTRMGGVSEGMFSITSSPTVKDYQEFSIKKCGSLTDYLHSLQVGDEIAVRGPYGNHFPVEDKLKGKNLLFIAGGIGLAPLRSVINYVLDNREDYGTVDILYGSRSADDLVQLKEIQEVWMKTEGVNVYLTM